MVIQKVPLPPLQKRSTQPKRPNPSNKKKSYSFLKLSSSNYYFIQFQTAKLAQQWISCGPTSAKECITQQPLPPISPIPCTIPPWQFSGWLCGSHPASRPRSQNPCSCRCSRSCLVLPAADPSTLCSSWTSTVTASATPEDWVVVVVVVVVVLSSLARILGECLTIHFLPVFFFF